MIFACYLLAKPSRWHNKEGTLVHIYGYVQKARDFLQRRIQLDFHSTLRESYILPYG
jgi:hypothetical protein